jgi:aspartate kinase
MIVMKFGGTSVGVPASFRNAVRQVGVRAADDPVVVASALSGVTNLLVDYARYPGEREALSEAFLRRHVDFAAAVGIAPDAFAADLAAWRETHARHDAAPHALGAAERDAVLAFGERLACALLAAGLRAAGIPAAAVLAGDAGLVTDDRFGAAHPLPESAALLRERLARRLPAHSGNWSRNPFGASVPVVTGFLGRTADGRTTTLGRGGSDYSAALIGAALGASEIQIWTDTSGMLSADPRVVPEARVVPHLSFDEASELAYFGARVLHPKTLLPAMERGIPVRILNTRRPGDPGSVITPAGAGESGGWQVKSIASKQGVTAVTVHSTRMLLAHGFLARVFEVFGRHRVVVDLVTTSEVSISVTVDDETHLAPALEELEGIGRVEVRRGLAVVVVVGVGAPRRVGLAGHLFTLLGGVGIGIEMISQGASRVNLSFVVAEADADRAVRLLHRGLGLDAEPVGAPEAAGRAGSPSAPRAARTGDRGAARG